MSILKHPSHDFLFGPSLPTWNPKIDLGMPQVLIATRHRLYHLERKRRTKPNVRER